MVASTISYPLCNWLLAACLSVAYEKDHPFKSSMFQSSKRQNQRAWPRKLVAALSRNVYGAGHQTSTLISSFYGSNVQNWMSSCLSFETCEEFYHKSKRLSSSLAILSDNVCSLVGSKSAYMNQWRRRRNGYIVAPMAMQPEKCAMLEDKPTPRHGRRVVVTGLGLVTSIGEDADTFYNNLLDGVSGVTDIEAFDCSEFPTKIAGEIKSFSPDGWVSPKLTKRAGKFVLYSLTAGKKALADGGITEQSIGRTDKTRCGVIIGSAMGGMKAFCDGVEALRVSYKKMNPFCIPFATSNISSAILAMDLGWMGPNYSISSACATSNFCILNSANHIIRGETVTALLSSFKSTDKNLVVSSS
ncbi:hypothetical protein Tsubulata_020220 [Turnera subulata]|uniref:beta-ketoacyl-[acyl-carrier-protein] synthase I n=1 Tax=Turnera subulata TaxID=218843 RepID=A0A9Q0JFU9_9ROSI|nr:hypothetical protein Tsubulata_020220 [Turnera subulata]